MGAIFSKYDFNEKRKDILAGQLREYYSGQMGLSEAEQRGVAAKATASAGQQVAAQQADIARQGMAYGGQLQGDYAAQQRNLGQQAAAAGMAAPIQARALSEQIRVQREAQLMAALQAQTSAKKAAALQVSSQAPAYAGAYADVSQAQTYAKANQTTP